MGDIRGGNVMPAAKRRRVEPPPPVVRYDFAALARKSEELRKYARGSSVDFSRDGATLAVTRAILRHHFQLDVTLPPGHLVPVVPVREQYIRWAVSLLSDAPRGAGCLLDVGTGPAAIYALLAARILPPSWTVVATEVEHDAADYAERNIRENDLCSSIRVLRRKADDSLVPEFANPHCSESPLRLTVCNPPFYDVGSVPTARPAPGTSSQLETKRGELGFLSRLAGDSRKYPGVWFTSLIGIKSDLPLIVGILRSSEVAASRVLSVELGTSARTRRWAVAWYFDETSVGCSLDRRESCSKFRRVLSIRLASNFVSLATAAPYLLRLGDEVFSSAGWVSKDVESSSHSRVLQHSDGSEVHLVVASGALPYMYRLEVKVASAGQALSSGVGIFAEALCQGLSSVIRDDKGSKDACPHE